MVVSVAQQPNVNSQDQEHNKRRKLDNQQVSISARGSGLEPQGTIISEDHFREHYTDPEIDNLRVASINALIYPQLLVEEFPMTEECRQTVLTSRKLAADIIKGVDDRLIVVVGPCSIHDPSAALEYASRLKAEKEALKDDLLIIMRVYFEKPRTTVGWKGLINDPCVDETYRVNLGLKTARQLLRDIIHIGVPCGCEFLDTMTPQYIADLVSWAAIGARTTECQLHRELASALSMPVGFKNSTSGDVDVAVDAIISAEHRHCFFSINKQGTASIVHSRGNADTHIILRGGKAGPNYGKEFVDDVMSKQQAKADSTPSGLVKGVILDCSHGNSNKDFSRQAQVVDDIVQNQLFQGSMNVVGVMMESNLFDGNQKVPSARPSVEHEPSSTTPATAGGNKHNGEVSISTPPDFSRSYPQDLSSSLKNLRYGISITDGCVSWLTTVTMLHNLAQGVRKRREIRNRASH